MGAHNFKKERRKVLLKSTAKERVSKWQTNEKCVFYL